MHILLPYLFLYKHHKWMFTLGIILAVVTLLSSTGLLSLSGWFLSSTYIIGSNELYGFNYVLPAAGVRLAAISRTVGKYFERLISHDATFRMLQHLRVRIFTKLLCLSPTRLMFFRQGELLNRIISDVNTLDHLYLRVLSPLIVAFVVIMVVMLGLSIVDLRSSLTLGFIMLFTFFLFPPLFYLFGRTIGKNLGQLRGEYRQKLTSWLQGQTELMIFGACDRYREQIEIVELKWNKEQCNQSKLTAFSHALTMLISGIAMMSMLWISEKNVRENSYFNTLVSFFAFFSFSVFEVLLPLTGAFQHLGKVIASATLLSDVFEQNQEIYFTNEFSKTLSQASFRLNEVSFTYEGRTEKVLENVTFSVKEGMHVALLGRNGCGKSTLLRLLTRSWDPKQGYITLNDAPLRLFSEKTLRTTIGVMPQYVHLFSASLRYNLLFSSSEMKDEILYAVLEQVGLKNLIVENGLNEWFGEGGRQLSGGELRRLAIARVILHDAPLILLDEPTEGLDSITEAQILKLIKEVFFGKTLLMVTHRLHGLSSFDKILVMDNGKIIEEGNHAELLLKKGLYFNFKQRF